jgi:hypothetical protein
MSLTTIVGIGLGCWLEPNRGAEVRGQSLDGVHETSHSIRRPVDGCTAYRRPRHNLFEQGIRYVDAPERVFDLRL